MSVKKFSCPLCHSQLEESKYYEIVGVWDEKKKIESELKKQLAVTKEIKNKLEKEKENLKSKLLKEKEEFKKKTHAQFEKQKHSIIKKIQDEASKERKEFIREKKKEIIRAEKKALEKGIETQKKRFENVNRSLQLKIKEIGLKDKQIKDLREQLKKGTTAQLEGYDLEHELMKELKLKFPNDDIEHHGKGGDLLHRIKVGDRPVALIVYECKKTQNHSKSHIIQIKDDVLKRNANYGVLVTFASEKNRSGFWVEKDIIVVHPFGAPYVADVLRKALIQLDSLKLSDKDLSERAKRILDYIKGSKFRNSVKDNINRAKELQELLKKEVEYHKTLWEKRHQHYSTIARQTQEIDSDSKDIVGEDSGQRDKEIIEISLSPRKKKRKVY